MDQSNPRNYLDAEREYFARIHGYFEGSSGSFSEKAYAFPRFVPRQALSYFLARNEVYRQIVGTHGSILDFGVYRGGSFFTWQQLGALYEPYNHIRKVVGFDSFGGFSELGERDVGVDGQDLALKKAGGMAYDGAGELREGIRLLDMNRPLGQVAKGVLVEGELPGSCASYLDEHQETVVALANFGLGLYGPTVELLRLIRPRLVKGSVLVFEDLNQATWPGETRALRDVFALGDISLERVPYCPHVSWARIGG
jgi:hypothetical protein